MRPINDAISFSSEHSYTSSPSTARGLATTMASNDSTKNLNLRNFDAYLVYSKRELVRYTKFPKLYGEMKYARPSVSCSSPIVLLKTNTV
jgi:hypothetical protein